MVRRSQFTAVCAVLTLGFIVLADVPAGAASPGRNGAIAFEYWRPGERRREAHVWTMARDGTHRGPIGLRRARWDPTWSPDATRIAYWNPARGYRADFSGSLEIMRPNGRFVQTVRGFAPTPAELSWSPNGERIVTSSFLSDPGSDGFYRLVIVDVSSGHIVFLSKDRPGADSDPAWSPDGRRIAFTRVHGGRADLYTMDRNGHHILRLTDDPSYDIAPDWAPNGSKLVFVADEDVAIVGRRGGPVTLLTNSPRVEQNAVFSPNGQRILFDRCCFGPDEMPAIFVMDLDGTHVRRLGRGFDPDWQSLGKPGPTP